MEQGPKSVNIHIISDSRGAGLEKTLSSITRDYNFSVTIRSGATFDILTNIAVAHKENFDYQIIVGGICSITTKEGRYVSYKRNEARKTQLKEQISIILDTLGTRVSVATIPPTSISKYNAHKHHSQAGESSWLEQQQQLNEELREINLFIESENHRTGTQQVYLDKASTANSVKRRGDNRTKWQWEHTPSHDSTMAFMQTLLWHAVCKNLYLVSPQMGNKGIYRCFRCATFVCVHLDSSFDRQLCACTMWTNIHPVHPSCVPLKVQPHCYCFVPTRDITFTSPVALSKPQDIYINCQEVSPHGSQQVVL